jgi:hypothetical protein
MIRGNVSFHVADVLVAQQLEADYPIALDTLRYWAVPQLSGDIFLIHHIGMKPDFEHILRVDSNSSRICYRPATSNHVITSSSPSPRVIPSHRPHDRNRQWHRDHVENNINVLFGREFSSLDEWVILGRSNTLVGRFHTDHIVVLFFLCQMTII